jgi:ribonuclease BN (tRNA processing enzyme)
MKLKFLGTRGYIEARTRRHRMHSSLLVSYYHRPVMVDCGEDWLGRLEDVNPGAIVITHAHPDHAWGLAQGSPCPVYATRRSWSSMRDFRIEDRRVIRLREHREIEGITFEAFGVVHSTRAPAVGYRIMTGATVVFYVPDLVYIRDRAPALAGVKLYIGDGASVVRPMVRKPKDVLIGHSAIRTQLTWCKKENIPRAVFTHCGSEIVTGDERKLGAAVRRLAKERGVRAEIAHDGMELIVR